LDFNLPQFTQASWVSEKVRSIRAPQLDRVKQAWRTVEWRSVCAGIRPCGLLQMYSDEYSECCDVWKKHGLSVVPLRVEEKAGVSGSYFVQAVIGEKHDTELFKGAWIHNDHEELGRFLGYPACCRDFFQHWSVAQKLNDPSWSIAQNTAGCLIEGTNVAVSGAPLGNILLRYAGVRAIPHLPCKFDCSASLELAARMLELYPSLGYSEESEWLQEMLDWPMEWSALHGIAEIHTPVMKFVTTTDATAEKLTVRWKGSKYPSDAARGLSFPYITGDPE
jgi:hypothetical protein